ncbi:MAG: TonB family protein [Nitrospiraceae bacterium]|nr:TonB family protein [Nitrospiraceae bacterium]
MSRLSLETQKGPENAGREMDSYTGLPIEGWRSAFIGAIGIHLVLAMLFVFAPGLWERHRPMPPVYTVRLFETLNMPSPRPVKTKRRVPEIKTKSKIKKLKKVKKEVTRKSHLSVKTRPRPKKAISLHPRRPRYKKAKLIPKKSRDTEKILRRRLKKIEQQVEERKEEAFIQKRLKAIRSSVEGRAKKAAVGPARSWTGSQEQNEALRLYCTKIWGSVRRHWVFPEQFLAEKGLISIVLVRIAQDGRIVKAWYEQKSGHALFDRSALNAVQEAGPFPPLPRVLRPGPVEIGIRFRPTGVGE